MPPGKITFNQPSIQGRELDHIRQAIAEGHSSGDGPFTARCRSLLEDLLGCSRALLTTSCTHALEMAALLLDLQPGDDVLVPAFTFVSTANAFALRGARPVFVDVRPDTLNMDERQVEALLTPRTRALVPVHYAGVGCELDVLVPLAARQGVALVEDNAHGLFARYRGRFLGTFGCLGTQSFHETKNITCGEGGALLVNDARYVARAEILREKGTNRSRFFRGEVDKYTWVDLGSSYVLSDILAAYLFGQLEQRESIQSRRQAVWERYRDGLAAWAAAEGVRLPHVPAHCEQSYHMFYLVLPTAAARERLLARLKAAQIQAVFHYVPLHTSPMGRHFGGRDGQCPVAEDLSERLLRLPFYTSLSPADQDRVIATITTASV